MARKPGNFLIQGSATQKLYEALPILPEPAITKIQLARKLGITGTQCGFIINRLPSNALVYEDTKTIGRIK